jgi:hypothetical protein
MRPSGIVERKRARFSAVSATRIVVQVNESDVQKWHIIFNTLRTRHIERADPIDGIGYARSF